MCFVCCQGTSVRNILKSLRKKITKYRHSLKSSAVTFMYTTYASHSYIVKETMNEWATCGSKEKYLGTIPRPWNRRAEWQGRDELAVVEAPSGVGLGMRRVSPLQLTRGSGGASWASPAGSGAEPRPKTHLGVFWRPQNAPLCIAKKA